MNKKELIKEINRVENCLIDNNMEAYHESETIAKTWGDYNPNYYTKEQLKDILKSFDDYVIIHLEDEENMNRQEATKFLKEWKHEDTN